MVRFLDTLPTNTSDTLDLSVFGQGVADTVFGLTNTDFITSDTIGGSLILGNTENDSLIAAGPNDTVYGGMDDDFLVSRAGRSVFFGDLGQDRYEARGSLGQDTVYGGTDNLSENRNQDSDDIFNFGNGQGGNLAFGNGGDDFLSGSGFGGDTLYGGIGDDTIQVVAIAGSGGGGGFGGGAFVPDTIGGLIQLTPIGLGIGAGAAGQLNVGVVADQGVLPTSNPGRNYLAGDKGNDVIFGLGDRDTLLGGEGNDQLFMLGQGGPATLGFVDEDGFNTEGTQSELLGVPRNNYLDGGVGDDSLWSFGGARGRQTLIGGEGNDTVVNRGTQVIGFANDGNDLIETANWDRVTLYGGAGDDTVQSLGSGTAGAGTNLLYGDKGNDTLISQGIRDTVLGGNADLNDTVANNNNDYLTLGGGTSLGFGNQGNDTLIGGGANTTLWGGQDNDRITATGISSYLSGDKGNDSVLSSGANSTLWGAEGIDTLITTATESTLIGGEGNDSLYARNGGGNNLLMAVSGDNVLVAGANTDTLMGGTGNDFLTGSGEVDTLRADDPGNDTLEGFLGADSLIGTRGSFDAFLYQTASTAELGDTITSFDGGTDKFVLSLTGFALDSEAISGLRTNIDFFTVADNESYSGTFGFGPNNQQFTNPAIVFDSQDQGGFLYWDPSGGGAPAGNPTADLLTIATIQQGTVNRQDFVLF